jgi:hypothetical protein
MEKRVPNFFPNETIPKEIIPNWARHCKIPLPPKDIVNIKELDMKLSKKARKKRQKAAQTN